MIKKKRLSPLRITSRILRIRLPTDASVTPGRQVATLNPVIQQPLKAAIFMIRERIMAGPAFPLVGVKNLCNGGRECLSVEDRVLGLS